MTEKEVEKLKKELALFKAEALAAREFVDDDGQSEQVYKIYDAARAATDEGLK